MKPFKVVIKRNAKEYNEYSCTITGATAGKILAIIHALEATKTPVGEEVLDAFQTARDPDGTKGDILALFSSKT